MYCHSVMLEEISALDKAVTETFSIGKSLMGRDIMCIKTGRGERKLFLGGAYHGLEYLTAALLVKFVSRYTDSTARGETFFGFNARALFDGVTLFTVPMVNPDGVDIAVNGIDLTNEYHRTLLGTVGIHDFKNTWQANARGVDINHNFDADWDRVLDKPSASKYGGEYPHSESETRAVVNLLRKENFDMMLAFHSQGAEIYCDFNGKTEESALNTARKMAAASRYEVKIPTGTASFGGCKDWFIKEFHRPGFTVEIGRGKNPLPMTMLDDVYAENAPLILCAINECAHITQTT